MLFRSQSVTRDIPLEEVRENQVLLNPESPEFTEQFDCYRQMAKAALRLAQSYQEKHYNESHLFHEF